MPAPNRSANFAFERFELFDPINVRALNNSEGDLYRNDSFPIQIALQTIEPASSAENLRRRISDHFIARIRSISPSLFDEILLVKRLLSLFLCSRQGVCVDCGVNYTDEELRWALIVLSIVLGVFLLILCCQVSCEKSSRRVRTGQSSNQLPPLSCPSALHAS